MSDPRVRSRAQHLSILFSICLAAIVNMAGLAGAQTVIASPGFSYAGVIFDTAGNLYGVTLTGGIATSNCPHGCGTVYELSPASGGTWALTTIYSFHSRSDGFAPYGGLIFDSSGNLYGTAQTGGAGGGGTVFKLSPGAGGSWSETTIYAFKEIDNDAFFPNSSLILDGEGNLYGTTAGGGTYFEGAVFRLSPTSTGWKENVLHSFGASGDGFDPHGPLVMDAQGKLYGTTTSGGAENFGTVYALTHNASGGWTEALIYTFTEGGQPFAGLILDSAHNLYGTSFNGGAFGAGTVFRLTRVESGGQLTWKHIVLYSFAAGTDGANPASPLIFDSAGNLYGTTDGGEPAGCSGSSDCGQVFKLTVGDTGIWSIAALYPVPSFLDTNGSVVLDSSGNIYGTAVESQNPVFGDVYQITQ
jgi:uncharacterized repeat protein (TIGR03803 family)